MFAQIDTKTVYSFLDSLVDLKSYINKAKSFGYKTIGIMDSNLYAAYHFIQMSEQSGLQGILGLSYTLRTEEKEILFYFIATNTAGYKNLLQLSTYAMSEGLCLEMISDHLEGITVIIPYDEKIEFFEFPFDYHIGVYPNTPQFFTNRQKFPLITVRFLEDEDYETLQVLHAIRQNQLLSQVEPSNRQECLLPCQEVEKLFKEKFPEALVEMERIVKNISYEFDHSFKLPRFNRNEPAVEQLKELTYMGLKKKGLTSKDYFDRLEMELGIIHKMGFDDYFLIVWDLLMFGRRNGYYMGMGRGSAAGSLVAYSLDITGIDPVKNHLIFERFLNEERYSMPDIDIDLPDAYRNKFLNYVKEKYGPKHSAQIVTFSTLAAKQAIRDVLKRYGIPEYELNNITRKIGSKDTLTSVYENNASFRKLISSKIEYQTAYKVAKRIEGFPRQTSIHAAGVVMSDDQLVNHIPLKEGDEMMITQYDAPSVEANGLLKMDFLGLRNLTLVQRMQEYLKSEKEISIDISKIDLEDRKTLELFSSGRTKGIFQFEQSGAIRLLKRVKPNCFEDIVATTSLNRPGASDYIDNFINRRSGREKVDLLDPSIAHVLDYTYGIMLYQEQVMQIAQIYAGFSLGRADLLRRAMSKKNFDEMSKMEDEFIKGSLENGHNIESAKDIFSRMVKFAGYGFNRSHAFAYSALAFQLAYFKTHYPDIFFKVMLNYANGSYIQEALDSGFKLGKFSLNNATMDDRIIGKTIKLGLGHLKGIPRDFLKWICQHDEFNSIEDFFMSLPLNYQKKDYIIPLIQIGLFDDFEKNRQKIINNLDNLFTFINELGSLFAESSYNWMTSEDYSSIEKYQFEVELLGVGISEHPLKILQNRYKNNFSMISQLYEGYQQTILVQLNGVRVIRTKTTGEQMAFLTVNDTIEDFDVTIFPKFFPTVISQLNEGQFYKMIGKVQSRDGKLQMILSDLERLSLKRFWLLVENHKSDFEISEILKEFPGNIPVVLHYQSTKETIESQKFKVEESSRLEEKLSKHVVKTVFR